MFSFWLLLASTVSLQANVTMVLGRVERDVTGDGKPEILQVVATGRTIENLEPVFTIESAGKTIYRYTLMPLTRTVGFDAGARVITLDEHRTRLKEFGAWFFVADHFLSPAGFVDVLRTSARLHIPEIPKVIAGDNDGSDQRDGKEIWAEILGSRATIFTFSPGGDVIVAIGWSEQAGRFYRLLSCC